MEASDLQRAAQVLFIGIVPAAGVVAWLVGLVLHGLGRNTSGLRLFVAYAVGVVMGATLNTALGSLQRQQDLALVLNAVVLLAIPLGFILVLAMFGRRRVAGLLLAGVATPWTVIWGIYLVEIVLGADWAPLFTGAMAVLGLVLLLVGAALAAAGDPVDEPDPAAPMGRPGSRRPGSMARTLMRDASYFPVGPSIVLPLAAATVTSLAIPGQAVGQLAIAVAAAVAGTEIELRWIPPRVKRALEGFHWVGTRDLATFTTATGSKVPTSAGGFKQWLARHPETDATRRWRVELLAYIGEAAQARAELARWVPADPVERFHAASLATELDWMQGAPADMDALRSLAVETGPDGSSERLAADGLVAWWGSRLRLADVDPDWRGPLADFRDRLGDAAAGLHARAMRRKAIVLPLVVAVTFVALGQLGR